MTSRVAASWRDASAGTSLTGLPPMRSTRTLSPVSIASEGWRRTSRPAPAQTSMLEPVSRMIVTGFKVTVLSFTVATSGVRLREIIEAEGIVSTCGASGRVRCASA